MKTPSPPASQVAAAMAARDAYAGPKTYGVGLRAALSQGQPGGWASDHRAESERFTGWHYIAIHALGLQAMKAQVYVFDDRQLRAGERGKLRARRKSLSKAYGLRKAVELGQVGDPLPDDHPLVRLMQRASPSQSGASFRYEQIQQLELTGRCYVWKVPGRMSGRTVERYVIPTALLSAVPPGPGLPTGGYHVNAAMANRFVRGDGFVEGGSTFWNVLGKTIPCEQMQVIGWPHPLVRDDGYSPMGAVALWTDTSEMIDKARWGHLKRGPDPSVGISLQDDVEVDQAGLDRLAAQFEAKWGGAEKSGGVFVAAGVKDFESLTMTPKNMAYDSGFLQLRDALLAARGVTPIAAGILDGGSYAAFYAALRGFVELSVAPRLSLLAEEDTEQLATEYGEGVSIEMEPAGVDDPALLEQQLASDISARARTRNEWRELRGLPPLDGSEGEELVGTGPAPVMQQQPDEQRTGEDGQPSPFDQFFKSRKTWFDRVTGAALNGNGRH